MPDALLATTITNPDTFNANVAAGTYDYTSDPQMKAAFDKESQMKDAGCFNDSPVGTSIDTDTLPATAKGTYLATVTGAFHFGSLATANPAGKFTLVPLPASNTETDNKVDLSYSNALVVNAKSPNLDLAKKFADFFGTADSLNLMATQYGLAPTIPNAAFVAPPSLAEVIKLQQANRVANITWFSGAKTLTGIESGVDNLFLGTDDVPALLKEIQTGYAADNAK